MRGDAARQIVAQLERVGCCGVQPHDAAWLPGRLGSEYHVGLPVAGPNVHEVVRQIPLPGGKPHDSQQHGPEARALNGAPPEPHLGVPQLEVVLHELQREGLVAQAGAPQHRVHVFAREAGAGQR